MNNWETPAIELLESYVNSFSGLSEIQKMNFQIKKEHSVRVAYNAIQLVHSSGIDSIEEEVVFTAGLYHDIGRFRQLVEYNTFDDDNSTDHGDYSVEVLQEKGFISNMDPEWQELIFKIIKLHNKFEIPKKLTDKELLYAKILRDSDKLDIYKVLTDYYIDTSKDPNHTLTWELPKGTYVSPEVARDILAEKLVSKSKVKSEVDIKILQLSWVYDLNFRSSFEILLHNRYLEKIYGSLPKNDLIIQIYRKIKVYAENKLLEKKG
ncbi:MAG: HD domain-containing protein [Prolixibacteraceae bacterium]|jgi:putative nucleotidyltransferase with HDIG domain|nr:HD domain-containing protein [Prolixibacteraceae bacterium]MDD4756512.1 HD domain-containing protein [Prolixibacteraceae bacterium]